MHELTDTSAYAVVHSTGYGYIGDGVEGWNQTVTYHDTLEDANTYAFETWRGIPENNRRMHSIKTLCISKVFDPEVRDIGDLWECEGAWTSDMASYRSVKDGRIVDFALNPEIDPWRLLKELEAQDWSNEIAEDALQILKEDVQQVYKFDLAPVTWCDPECDTIIQPGMTADRLYYAEYVMYGNAKTAEQISSNFFHRMRSVSFETANKRWEGYR